ncbi:glycosyltransferase family 4 protein [Kaistella sp. G5-32]|uniref:Glycosyltransferase family 4 protein n=2 Tax=Kaistella gelatinilytica TaxID=2787636 RepID=A0ABS0FC12_9FLAO|nr:glycosyltransferase family 4 protein [Kaistella gelatinilytica]
MSLNILLKDQLRYLSDFYQVTAISGAGKDMDEVLEREGVKVKEIEMSREISIFKDFVSLITLYFYFKKEKPDIIHSITPKAGLLSMVAGKLAGVPVRMHTFTGLIFPSKKGILKEVLIWMDRLLAMCATHIYPEGKGVQEDLINYRITRKPLKIIANGNVNGIDTAYYNRDQISSTQEKDLKNELGISENDFVYIFVGRLVKDKGINELVAAFKILSSERSLTTLAFQPELLLVGPFEPDLDPLHPETLNEIETNPHIVAVGFQQEVRPYFAISHALVFPSYREGFPNVVLQAGSMGLPSIVTDINGCNEIIQDGFNGLIVPPKDVHSLQSAMEELLLKPILYERLKSKAQESILPYEQKAVWDAMLAEYREVAKERV